MVCLALQCQSMLVGLLSQHLCGNLDLWDQIPNQRNDICSNLVSRFCERVLQRCVLLPVLPAALARHLVLALGNKFAAQFTDHNVRKYIENLNCIVANGLSASTNLELSALGLLLELLNRVLNLFSVFLDRIFNDLMWQRLVVIIVITVL